MNTCLTDADFQQIGNEMLDGFDRRVASIPNELCAPFHQEARQLEVELSSIYRTVAMCARREERLEVVAGLWRVVVALCDSSLQKLGELIKKHPYCNAQIYYDRTLDLRNKCHRLQTMHT
jgi:hypothetical protein